MPLITIIKGIFFYLFICKKGVELKIKFHSNIILWSYRFQLFFDFGGHLQAIDKLMHTGFIDAIFASCQFFEGLVWLRELFATQYGLYRFGNNSPIIFEVGLKASFIE